MVQPEPLRKEWKEALEQLLFYTVRQDHKTAEVWQAKVNRIERIARYNKIQLNPHAERR